MSVTAPSPDGTPIGDVLHQHSLNPTSDSVKVSTLAAGALYGTLSVNAPPTTHSTGARAPNAYAGHRPRESGRCALRRPRKPAIDVSASIGSLNVECAVEAKGTPGLALGSYTTLPSNAIRVDKGGDINSATMTGPIRTTAPATAGVIVGHDRHIGMHCAAATSTDEVNEFVAQRRIPLRRRKCGTDSAGGSGWAMNVARP
ncbi:hypothetical protein ACWF82_20840 [Nocardia sp. NPDC055053]